MNQQTEHQIAEWKRGYDRYEALRKLNACWHIDFVVYGAIREGEQK